LIAALTGGEPATISGTVLAADSGWIADVALSSLGEALGQLRDVVRSGQLGHREDLNRAVKLRHHFVLEKSGGCCNELGRSAD
jgi:hypothetical protein